MQILVKEIEYCRLNVMFEADQEQVENKLNEVVKYFKGSNVPGFRPGKATEEAIKLHYKHKIHDVMKSELSQNAFHTVIAEKNIRPFGQPQFLSTNLEGSNFKCNFCINQIPEIELAVYKGFDVPKGQIPNAVEMAEKILQELRVRNGDTVPFSDEDFVQSGDTVIINYEGFLPEQEHSTLKKDGELFVVGKSSIEGFNDNLLGMKIGEKREFVCRMPSDFDPKIADKDIKMVVELIMASKAIPCALDDALAQKIGAANLQDMISMTQGMASARVQEHQQKYLSEQVASRLVEAHDFEIPSWLALFEAQLLARQYGSNWENISDEHKDNFLKFATKNVKLSIILDKIRETEPDAQLTDEEVIKLMKLNINTYRSKMQDGQSKSDEEVWEAITQSGYMPAFVATIRDDYALDFVIKTSNILE